MKKYIFKSNEIEIKYFIIIILYKNNKYLPYVYT
jgi:hypothetical protein